MAAHEPRELGMTDDNNALEASRRLEDAERRLADISEIAPNPELRRRLEDAERRLADIAEIAAGQVDTTGMAEMDLEDAELRLNRIHDLARSSP